MSNDDFFFSCADSLPSPTGTHSSAVATNITLSANAIIDFDTQPISNSLGDQLPNASNAPPPWGLLFGLSSDMPQTQLTLEEYVIGRNDGPPVNIVLPRPPDTEKSKLNMWLSYSRVQFRIRRRQSGIVEIEDCSSNGTFLNGKRLAKGIPAVLENNSEIALSLAKNRVMMFADLSILDDPTIPTVLRNRYRFSKQLGQGACGEVQLAFSKRTGVPVAIKIVHRSRFFTEAPAVIPPHRNAKQAAIDKNKAKEEDKHSVYAQAVREAKLMQTLSHPCIIKILEVFDEPPASDMFLILEYAQGGELFDKIVGNGKLSEPFAKYIFFQVALAVQYLHSQGITHRDLKPENILLSSDDEFPIAKLADFGLSKIVGPATVLRTYCGTPTYLAPEIVRTKGNGAYSKKVDLWSLGVILFAALAGYPPFYVERSDMTLEEQIMNGSYSFPSERWSGISVEAISMIKSLLCVEPARRLSADQAVAHTWMASDSAMIDRVNDVVFGGHGIAYYWSTTSSTRNGTDLIVNALRTRPSARPAKPTSRLSSARSNEVEKTDSKDDQKRHEKEEIRRPGTADGVRPLRRKNRDSIENGRPGAISALSSGQPGIVASRYASPVPVKLRGIAGENSRRVQDPLACAKTPKVVRRGK